MAENFKAPNGFVANGDSKIIGDLNLNGNLLNISNNTNLATKQYIDEAITAGINEAIARVQYTSDDSFGINNDTWGNVTSTKQFQITIKDVEESYSS